MHVAVLRARLSPTVENIDAAAMTISRYAHPMTQAAAEAAFGSGDDFCDWDSGASGSDQLEDISANCSNWGEFIRDTYVLRAHVLLLMLADPAHYAPAAQPFGQSWPMVRGTMAMNLDPMTRFSLFDVRIDVVEKLLIGLHNGYPSITEQVYIFQPNVDALVDLHIVAAETAVRRGAQMPDTGIIRSGRGLSQAQEHLRAALRWTQPAHQPNRFLQIARRYIEIDDAVRYHDPERTAPHEALFREWLIGNIRVVETMFGRTASPD
jgi:hypothetical protein